MKLQFYLNVQYFVAALYCYCVIVTVFRPIQSKGDTNFLKDSGGFTANFQWNARLMGQEETFNNKSW